MHKLSKHIPVFVPISVFFSGLYLLLAFFNWVYDPQWFFDHYIVDVIKISNRNALFIRSTFFVSLLFMLGISMMIVAFVDRMFSFVLIGVIGNVGLAVKAYFYYHFSLGGLGLFLQDFMGTALFEIVFFISVVIIYLNIRQERQKSKRS